MALPVLLLAAFAFSPVETGSLRLSNVRATYGVLGPDRPDNKILPGDTLVISYDIEGIQPAADGKAHYRIGMEVKDRAGAVHFKQAPKERTVKMTPGAQSLPGVATLHVGLDQPPGEYAVTLTVTDETQHSSKEVTKPYEVVSKQFGLVRVGIDGDATTKSVDPLFHTDRPGRVSFSAVGFSHGPSGQPDVRVVMTVQQDGRTAFDRPNVGVLDKGVPGKALVVPMEFQLQLTHSGRYTVELRAEDRVSGQTAAVTFPITVSK
jgi:hypothetical protein